MAFPTTSIVDDFNRSNEGPPPSASWSYPTYTGNAGLKVVSNQCVSNATAGNDRQATSYLGTSPEADVEGYFTIVTIPTSNAEGGKYASVWFDVRMASVNNGSEDGYQIEWERYNSVITIYKVVDGVFTSLQTFSSQTMANGYKFGFALIGDDFEVFKDMGGGWVSVGTYTDTNNTYPNAGKLGIGAYEYQTTTVVLDDFGGGTVASGETKSLTDTSSGTDNISISVSEITSKSVADSSLGIDQISQLLASLSIPDVGAGISPSDIYISLYGSDTGLGTDNISVTKPSGIISGSTVWGHSTGALETNIRTFTGNWTGTGSITGAGDEEKLVLDTGQYMISEVVDTGVGTTITLLQNEYSSGDTVTLQYRHGATQAACEAASWNDYTVSFESLGYVQVRVSV